MCHNVLARVQNVLGRKGAWESAKCAWEERGLGECKMCLGGIREQNVLGRKGAWIEHLINACR